jgi:HIRAN domain-containing protein
VEYIVLLLFIVTTLVLVSWSRLLTSNYKRKPDGPKLERHPISPVNANREIKYAANLPGPGTFSTDIVGESHYQSALESICGGCTDQGHEKIVEAVLVHEDDNPYDNKAIRVDIQGNTVGYLSRENARQYRKRLENAGHKEMTATCSAMVVGGWDRGNGDKGHFGVRLDLPNHKRQDYYVYVHKDPDGNVFYVGKGTGQRAWSQDNRDAVWHRYVSEKLGGRYEVEIIKNELKEEEALELENEVMLKQGDRLLNLGKPVGAMTVNVSIDKEGKLKFETISQPSNANSTDSKTKLEETEHYCELKKNNKAFVAATKAFEKTDLETAAKRYREALLKMKEYEELGRRLARSPGLRGEYENFPKRGDIGLLNRLTLCLIKLNRGTDAKREAEQYFADFPDDRDTSAAKAITNSTS